MEQLLHDIPMTVVYIDDILVTGRTPEDHDRDQSTVLTRLQDTGIRLNKEKCAFRQRSCTDVDHVINYGYSSDGRQSASCTVRGRS